MTTLLLALSQGTDQLPIWPNRVFNVISAVTVWTLALFASYWKAHPQSFKFSDWWRDDRTRFIAGCVVTLAVVILKATSTGVDEMLKLLGFQVSNTSGVAYGLAIAAFLQALKPVQKQNGKNTESTNK